MDYKPRPWLIMWITYWLQYTFRYRDFETSVKEILLLIGWLVGWALYFIGGLSDLDWLPSLIFMVAGLGLWLLCLHFLSKIWTGHD